VLALNCLLTFSQMLVDGLSKLAHLREGVHRLRRKGTLYHVADTALHPRGVMTRWHERQLTVR